MTYTIRPVRPTDLAAVTEVEAICFPAADSTAMNSMTALYERCKKNGVTLILSHVNEQPMRAMEKAGFVDLVGRENFCRNIEEALDHADKMLEK